MRLSLDQLDNPRLAELCGPLDEHLRQIEAALDITVSRRGAHFDVHGRRAPEAIELLRGLAATRGRIDIGVVQLALVEAGHAGDGAADAGGNDDARGAGRGKPGAAVAAGAGIASLETARARSRRKSAPRTIEPDDASNDGSADLDYRELPADADGGDDARHRRAPTDDNGAPVTARLPGHPLEEPANPVLRTRRHDLHGRTPRQRDYLRAILSHDISFGVGPAGTGKTYLAVACAVDALERDAVQRVVLTRPAVEAGERLGFLPGDLAQKVDPYLRPLYDALYDLLGFDKTLKLQERQAIEIAPLAYMRGRTLNNAFVILDEAQNTTPEQMKMFLTRIGFGSKAVVTGDITQVDLPRGHRSGLADALEVLDGVRGISFTRFTSADVVRHPLVGRIVDAYERASQQN
ncbi:PhoH family protein [Derxia gummosa]|uniref:PhoH-like protein n=1 Tax=Derxia gummosa DSM 723 TaxID=1121388 RepID=A0A8B6X1Y0_9BURK|nr:PhoH family protein [Derxia gummosa]